VYIPCNDFAVGDQTCAELAPAMAWPGVGAPRANSPARVAAIKGLLDRAFGKGFSLSLAEAAARSCGMSLPAYRVRAREASLSGVREMSALISYHYFGSGPGGPPGIPGGGITGVELGRGTGAGFTISGSTPGGGLITPPLASSLSLRLFSCSSTTLPPCTPPGRDASGRTFSGIV
jgi:hypothetical protein